jgi:hypothetical protein
MMEDEIYFEISDGPDIIKIEPLQWTHPNSDNDWDRNWISSIITIKGGAFRGQFSCDLLSSDFELFKREMNKSYNNLNEIATFKTIEGQIEIKCVGDGLGHFAVNCKAMDEVGTGNELNISMSFDQTSIPELVRQLNNITKAFPIQGSEFHLSNE